MDAPEIIICPVPPVPAYLRKWSDNGTHDNGSYKSISTFTHSSTIFLNDGKT
jgi:hypothetical protein